MGPGEWPITLKILGACPATLKGNFRQVGRRKNGSRPKATEIQFQRGGVWGPICHWGGVVAEPIWAHLKSRMYTQS